MIIEGTVPERAYIVRPDVRSRVGRIAYFCFDLMDGSGRVMKPASHVESILIQCKSCIVILASCQPYWP